MDEVVTVFYLVSQFLLLVIPVPLPFGVGGIPVLFFIVFPLLIMVCYKILFKGGE